MWRHTHTPAHMYACAHALTHTNTHTHRAEWRREAMVWSPPNTACGMVCAGGVEGVGGNLHLRAEEPEGRGTHSHGPVHQECLWSPQPLPHAEWCGHLWTGTHQASSGLWERDSWLHVGRYVILDIVDCTEIHVYCLHDWLHRNRSMLHYMADCTWHTCCFTWLIACRYCLTEEVEWNPWWKATPLLKNTCFEIFPFICPRK